jgi:hypothetical protein
MSYWRILFSASSPGGFTMHIDGMNQTNPNAYGVVWTMNADGSGEISTGAQCSGVGCAPRRQPDIVELVHIERKRP